ncbi:MAG: enoyl-CoA hydratase, partial [Nitriliruptorales bacterium]|nr:enoyl-CoA hydratase [Nitriliruptorales bacterium]
MHVRIEHHDRVALLELNRAERRNAIGPAMAGEIASATRSLNSDERVGAVVLAGAGPSFCAGADMKERLTGPAGSAAVFAAVRGASWAVHDISVPVVAAIHGHALGAGLELAAMCDYRIAEQDALLGLPEVRQGITSGGGLLALASLMARGALSRLAFSGRAEDAAGAKDLGIVDEVVHAGQARAAALSIAEEFAAHPRAALIA